MKVFAEATNDDGSLLLQPVRPPPRMQAMAPTVARNLQIFMNSSPLKSWQCSFESETMHEVVQRRSTDAEQIGCLAEIAVHAPQHSQHGVSLGMLANLP